MLQGQPIYPLKHALQIFTDTSKEGRGTHLKELTARGTWSLLESKLHINYLELKLGLSGSKRVPRPLLKQHSCNSYRQHHSSWMGDEVEPSVCSCVENPHLVYQETDDSQSSTHPRPPECDSRQSIQTRPNHLNRMIPPSRSLPSNMPRVALASSGPVCHQVQQQISSLFHRFQTPWCGQWMHSACAGRICTHMPSHQSPSWAK